MDSQASDLHETTTTETTSSTDPPPPTYQPLNRLIAIPRVCNLTDRLLINLPFVRAYTDILLDYGITEETFLEFLDELNIIQAGHTALKYMQKASQAIRFAGHIDPTRITELVGQCSDLTARLIHMAYIKGPFARRTAYLNRANRMLFHPRHLEVSIVSGKQLRKILGLHPKFPLCASLCPLWTVPSKTDLVQGMRSTVRVPGRQLCQLIDYVYDLDLAAEAKKGWGHEQGKVRRDAAKVVRDWQVLSEVQHEIWRGEAIQLYEVAGQANDPKVRKKLLKKAGEMDKEVRHTEKITWLVVQNWGI
ncbi:hypothetical protein AbraIFM66950_011544 [Aspergillus brasiliensis]|nr:hypothetical protein AbraIFM66950_011544 [Aspergillus brasiliensis]